jgi:D-tyrosyl-tRNA(Tyr) deacylase
MKVVAQRVRQASVEIDNQVVGRIGQGLVLLIGVAEADTEVDVEFVANKCVNLRIFQDEQGKMNRSVIEEKGEVLAISQFTLLADTRRGRRPSFIGAANPEKGEKLYTYFINCLRETGLHVETGVFGAMMDVHLVNAGPVTVIVDSKGENKE